MSISSVGEEEGEEGEEERREGNVNWRGSGWEEEGRTTGSGITSFLIPPSPLTEPPVEHTPYDSYLSL